jgi:hypothetical protein
LFIITRWGILQLLELNYSEARELKAEFASGLDNSGRGRIDSTDEARTKSGAEGWPCSLTEQIPDREIGVGVRSFAIAKDSLTGKEMVCRP